MRIVLNPFGAGTYYISPILLFVEEFWRAIANFERRSGGREVSCKDYFEFMLKTHFGYLKLTPIVNSIVKYHDYHDLG
jgi:hypothetical protein